VALPLGMLLAQENTHNTTARNERSLALANDDSSTSNPSDTQSRTSGDRSPDSNRSEDKAINDAGAFEEAPWNEGEAEGNVADSGPITDDYADIINPGTTTLDEEFAGAGGTGTIEKSPGQ
jgi:hypothetical protein